MSIFRKFIFCFCLFVFAINEDQKLKQKVKEETHCIKKNYYWNKKNVPFRLEFRLYFGTELTAVIVIRSSSYTIIRLSGAHNFLVFTNPISYHLQLQNEISLCTPRIDNRHSVGKLFGHLFSNCYKDHLVINLTISYHFVWHLFISNCFSTIQCFVVNICLVHYSVFKSVIGNHFENYLLAGDCFKYYSVR